MNLLHEAQQRARLRNLRVIVEVTGEVRFVPPLYCHPELSPRAQIALANRPQQLLALAGEGIQK